MGTLTTNQSSSISTHNHSTGVGRCPHVARPSQGNSQLVKRWLRPPRPRANCLPLHTHTSTSTKVPLECVMSLGRLSIAKQAAYACPHVTICCFPFLPCHPDHSHTHMSVTLVNLPYTIVYVCVCVCVCVRSLDFDSPLSSRNWYST